MSLDDTYSAELESIVRQIRLSLMPRRIILFGSLARGEVREDADIDLLIVMPSDEPFGDRVSRVYREVRHHLPMDALVYTPEEMERAPAERDSFILDVLETGKVLYDAA